MISFQSHARCRVHACIGDRTYRHGQPAEDTFVSFYRHIVEKPAAAVSPPATGHYFGLLPLRGNRRWAHASAATRQFGGPRHFAVVLGGCCQISPALLGELLATAMLPPEAYNRFECHFISTRRVAQRISAPRQALCFRLRPVTPAYVLPHVLDEYAAPVPRAKSPGCTAPALSAKAAESKFARFLENEFGVPCLMLAVLALSFAPGSIRARH